MNELAERVWALRRRGELALPLPGRGYTPERHETLMRFGREDLSLGRIIEAHTDALAILAEAGRTAHADGLYGVWASDGPKSQLAAMRGEHGTWCLDGVKQYCSGASFLNAALVTAHGDDGVLLFEVPLDHPGIRILETTWLNPALADTATGPVAFDSVVLPAGARMGPANWYLQRPGFWHRAIGPPACWAGGALSLIDGAKTLNRKDPHSRAQVGARPSAGEWVHCWHKAATKSIGIRSTFSNVAAGAR